MPQIKSSRVTAFLIITYWAGLVPHYLFSTHGKALFDFFAVWNNQCKFEAPIVNKHRSWNLGWLVMAAFWVDVCLQWMWLMSRWFWQNVVFVIQESWSNNRLCTDCLIRPCTVTASEDRSLDLAAIMVGIRISEGPFLHSCASLASNLTTRNTL